MKYFFILLLLFTYSYIYAAQEDEKEDAWDFVIDSTQKEVNKHSDNKKNAVKSISDSDGEKKKKRKKGMDFSDMILESDDLDEEVEKEEEKEIDEYLYESKKNTELVDLKKVREMREKEKKVNLFLSFLKLRAQLDYQNLMLFDNIPYQNIAGFEMTTSIMGLELESANAFIGEIGYRIFSNGNMAQAFVMSPLMVNFNFKKWGKVFPFKVSIFKIYFFRKTIVANSDKKINLFFEYLSLSMSWQFFKDDSFSSNVFFGFSFGPDDINTNPKRESILFSIGITGEFSPIKIEF